MTTPVKTDLEQLKQDVERKFQEMRAALHMREKLLLRQIDVIEQQIGRANSSNSGPSDCAATGARDIKFEADQEAVLLASIRSFGRFQLDNMNLALQDVYLQHEDYIAPTNDHETMYKCLMQNGIGSNANIANNNINENNDLGGETAIVVDFSKNKSLIEHNAKHMNESIINITLQEAKELIKKAKVKRDTTIPPLNLEELDDEFESSIAEAVSSLAQETPASLGAKPKMKKSRFKPKITINNCNGTINLRNIASLTINCASEDAVSADIPVIDDEDGTEVVSTTRGSKKSSKKSKSSKSSSATGAPALPESSSTTPTSSSNYSSTTSSRSQSKKLNKTSKGKNQQQKPQTKSISLSKSLTTIRQPAKGSSAAQQPYAFVASPDEPNSLDDDHDDDDIEYHEMDDDGRQSEEIVPTCEFYNRLLNEIKNSLREKPQRIYEPTTTVSSSTYNSRDDTTNSGAPQGQPQDAGVTTTTNSTSNSGSSRTSLLATSSTSVDGAAGSQQGKRLILKNFENLKIILEANSGDEDSFHPVQIEQWLAEIITEADLEPMQNTEILEHSKLHNETL